MPAITPAPSASQRLVELLVERFGRLGCRHVYMLKIEDRKMYLECELCDHKTTGFVVAGKKD